MSVSSASATPEHALPAVGPYARALGARRDELPERLRQYFEGVPPGHVGIGEGVFERVGTRYRWLRLALLPWERRHALLSTWATQVPFRVTNRVRDGRALAVRELMLPSGTWTMTDAVSFLGPGRVVDRIGTPAAIAAAFDVSVRGGAVQLRSRRVGLRLGLLRLSLPPIFSPRVDLREELEGDTEHQRVTLTVRVPLLGIVYEYSGRFVYRIEEEHV